MKLKAFTTGLGLIGAIACLAIIKMAEAQTPSAEQLTEPAVYVPTERELACERITKELGDVSPDGSSSGFDPFKGITLSAEQQVAYDKFDAEKDAKLLASTANVETAEYPDGYLAFIGPGSDRPPEVDAFIQNALNTSKSGQWREWNQKLAELGYEQYGQFEGETLIYYTPEMDRESTRLGIEFYDQLLTIMTPEQLPIARENFANLHRITELCDRRGPINVGGVAPGTPPAR